jgi:hypothetical protein
MDSLARPQTLMEQLILRVTITSLAALIAASCSRRSDSESNSEHEKAEKRGEVADLNRRAHPGSKPSAPGAHAAESEQTESQPSANDIIEDCHGFVWLTKTVPRDGNKADCPQCPSNEEATQVLTFRSAEVERVSCTGERCEVAVVIHATFNPSKGGIINGGLTGWIPLQQREQYSRGETPSGEQLYEAMITYRREGSTWRAIEFARP